MFIFPILLLLLAIWLIPFLFQSGSSMSNRTAMHRDLPSADGSLTPLEVLNLRYAKGDISEEEYHKIKKNLQS